MKAHLLYVEDDQDLSFVTIDQLEEKGYKVTHCKDGNEAMDIIEKQSFDLCILDIMLPGFNGFDIAKKIRTKNHEVPIIFLSAKSHKDDRIHGLTIGADDYMTKPYSIEELILKIEVFLKRNKITSPADTVMKIGIFKFDYKNLSLVHNDSEKLLTQREADLLKYMVDNKNNVIKRGEVLEKIWGENDYFLGRSMDVFVSRLRKYLKPDSSIKIENVHGVGFRFKCCE